MKSSKFTVAYKALIIKPGKESWTCHGLMPLDLPLNFHPFGIIALWVDMPIGAG